MRSEIVVIGGGIVGCAAAAILADRGVRVTLVERTAIGAGASGRNLGAIQHPFDAVLAALYRDSLTRYRALADGRLRLRPSAVPVGLLLLNRDADAAAAQAQRRDAVPELRPLLLSADEVAVAEPALRPGPAAVRLETGYPIPPASATTAWAALADDRGAQLLTRRRAMPVVESGAVTGVRLADGGELPPTPSSWPPGHGRPRSSTRRRMGADPGHLGRHVQLRLAGDTPRHIVEEDEVDTINRADAASERALPRPTGGSTVAVHPRQRRRCQHARVDVPARRARPGADRRAAPAACHQISSAIEDAEVLERRICARPQSIDGRPFIGPLPGVDGLFVCAGHGPWGISTGPGSAAIAARAILDGTAPPPELAATARS